jgi:hypothetical protein
VLKSWVDLISIAEDQHSKALGNLVGPFSSAAFKSPIMDLIGVNNVLAANNTDGVGAPAYSNRFSVIARPHALPPAFFAGCWDLVEPSTQTSIIRRMNTQELHSTVVLERTPEVTRALADDHLESCQAGPPVSVEQYESNTVALSVNAPSKGVLVLTDAWYPGWTAAVDGSVAPMLSVDVALRGVVVGPGPHRVVYRFEPRWLLPGIVLTATSLLIVCVMLLSRRIGMLRGIESLAE